MKPILLFCVFTFLCFFKASSCYCVLGTMSDAFKNSDLIISGIVISVRDQSEKQELNYNKIYTVQILKLFKGNYRRKTVEIASGFRDDDCGFVFSVGEKYIIFARRNRGYSVRSNLPIHSFFTDECTRTKVYTEKEVEEIKKFKRKHFFWWF